MLLFASGVSLLFAHVFFGNLWLLEQVYNFRQLRNRKLTYKERVKCYCNIVVHFLQILSASGALGGTVSYINSVPNNCLILFSYLVVIR